MAYRLLLINFSAKARIISCSFPPRLKSRGYSVVVICTKPPSNTCFRIDCLNASDFPRLSSIAFSRLAVSENSFSISETIE